MKIEKKFVYALLLCILCCAALLNGCRPNADEAQMQEEQNPGGMQVEEIESLGTFTVEDIAGESYTQEMFADYDLTLVNVFTTWCTPCVREIPDLEQLKNEMADQGVNVVGFILDALDSSGEPNQETVEKAKLLAEKTAATYPFLIPDEGYLNGRLAGIVAVPETFFVDKEGNIVGNTYSGSRSFEEWMEIVENERKAVTE